MIHSIRLNDESWIAELTGSSHDADGFVHGVQFTNVDTSEVIKTRMRVSDPDSVSDEELIAVLAAAIEGNT
jgi:hypothetical protein